MDLRIRTEQAVSQLLAEAAETGSDNRIDQSRLRQHVRDYLGFWAEELASFPELRGQSHWNVTMADGDPTREGLYVLECFHDQRIELLCGRGDSGAIRHFCEHDAPEDPADVLQLMHKKFPASAKTMTLDQQAAEAWLERKLL
ncbi:MAG: hypothetical protein LLG01_07385 [Planctomycetaceae bacterium]|nr:hypothetical protein [Planctomycetaceae bacterium]